MGTETYGRPLSVGDKIHWAGEPRGAAPRIVTKLSERGPTTFGNGYSEADWRWREIVDNFRHEDGARICAPLLAPTEQSLNITPRKCTCVTNEELRSAYVAEMQAHAATQVRATDLRTELEAERRKNMMLADQLGIAKNDAAEAWKAAAKKDRYIEDADAEIRLANKIIPQKNDEIRRLKWSRG